MRLFVAALPPTPVLEHLEHALTSVRGALDPGDARGPLRWTPSDQRHLTLAFYGEVPEGALDDLVTATGAVAAGTPQLDLSLRGAGVFDRRTLWVGCAGDTAPLAQLTGDVVDVGRRLFGRHDDRPRSRAHLTVARVRRGERRTGDVAALAHALAVYQGPSWVLEDIAVVASQLGAGPAGHPVHEVLARLPLRAVAG